MDPSHSCNFVTERVGFSPTRYMRGGVELDVSTELVTNEWGTGSWPSFDKVGEGGGRCGGFCWLVSFASI